MVVPPLQNLSAPSTQAFDKLASLLRAPFVPLYASYTEPALGLSAAILEKILTDNVQYGLPEPDGIGMESAVKEGWEKVACQLLSGVMVCRVSIYY